MHRQFSIHAVAAVSGILVMVACGTTTVVESTPGDAGGSSSSSGGSGSGGSSSGSSSGEVPPADAATDAVADASDDADAAPDAPMDAARDVNPRNCPPNIPLTAADLDKEIGFKSAVSTPGVCSAADITQLQTNLMDLNMKSYFDLGTGLGAACRACVISKDTDDDWQVVVGTSANDGETGFINFGACFGFIEGMACGKALQYEQFCYGIACNECTSSQPERQECVAAAGAGSGMCTDFGDTTATACPTIQTTAKKCNSLIDAVKTLCGPS